MKLTPPVGGKNPAVTSPRCGSPVTGCSILITSAPQSASTAPEDGTNHHCATSITRTPASTCSIDVPPRGREVPWGRARGPAPSDGSAAGVEPEGVRVLAQARETRDEVPTERVGNLLPRARCEQPRERSELRLELVALSARRAEAAAGEQPEDPPRGELGARRAAPERPRQPRRYRAVLYRVRQRPQSADDRVDARSDDAVGLQRRGRARRGGDRARRRGAARGGRAARRRARRRHGRARRRGRLLRRGRRGGAAGAGRGG